MKHVRFFHKSPPERGGIFSLFFRARARRAAAPAQRPGKAGVAGAQPPLKAFRYTPLTMRERGIAIFAKFREISRKFRAQLRSRSLPLARIALEIQWRPSISQSPFSRIFEKVCFSSPFRGFAPGWPLGRAIVLYQRILGFLKGLSFFGISFFF